jgi:ABC-type Fe3+/spermidine/putrescine transport system ATPase subunit
VRDNIAFGLRRFTTSEREARVGELVSLLGLHGLEDRRPARISGGQAQRVALARALAPRPRLLLLDEPFSALDSAIRVGLRRELARLKRELDLTIVFVTHDLREAFNLADKIAVFDGGRVLQVDSRDAVFERPASARVAELTEVRNIWRGRVAALDAGGAVVQTGGVSVRTSRQLPIGTEVDVCIRPERVLLVRPERLAMETPRDTVVTAEIVDEIGHGASHTLFFRVDGDASLRDVEVDLPAHPYEVLGVGRQRRWALTFPRDAVHVMVAEQG